MKYYNTSIISIIVKFGETLEKAIENFEVIPNFEDFAKHINIRFPNY